MRSPLFTWGDALFGESEDWSSPGKTPCWPWKLTCCPPRKEGKHHSHHQLGPSNNRRRGLGGGKVDVYIQQIIMKRNFSFPNVWDQGRFSRPGRHQNNTGSALTPPNSSPLPLTFMISHQVWFSWTDRFANVVSACRRKSSLIDLGPVLHRRVLRADYRLPPTRFKSAIDLFHLQPAAFLRGTRPSVVKDAAVWDGGPARVVISCSKSEDRTC